MTSSEFGVPLTGTALAKARTYQLHIRLAHAQQITVGRLGRFAFAAGTYLYTGSARRNMRARLSRHLADDKTLHWHIDHLLAVAQAKITRIHLSAEIECVVNQSVNGEIPVPGFGASDCRRGCGSHLKYMGHL